MTTPQIVRIPTLSTEEKTFLKTRFRMLVFLDTQQIEDPRKEEALIFTQCPDYNAYISSATNAIHNGGKVKTHTIIEQTSSDQNVSSYFEQTRLAITDSRNVLSRCRVCKSVNVTTGTAQIRSAGKCSILYPFVKKTPPNTSSSYYLRRGDEYLCYLQRLRLQVGRSVNR